MAEGFSLININGEISKPATVLIQKISDAVGGLYKPYQIKRLAKAEAEAEIIKEQAQIEITNLQRRALTRFVSEEAKKQNSIETITEKAIPQLTDSSTPQDIENDWITNFFDKCRVISDDEMQLLWAKVLSGEANSPGTFSKRTVNSLGSLDKVDARLFTNLCSFILLSEEEPFPFIYDEDAQIYRDQQINFPDLTHLDDIGLITFGSVTGFTFAELLKQIVFDYYGTTLIAEFNKPDNNDLKFGRVVLTHIGQEICSICGASAIDGFLDYITDQWAKQGLHVISPPPKQQIQ